MEIAPTGGGGITQSFFQVIYVPGGSCNIYVTTAEHRRTSSQCLSLERNEKVRNLGPPSSTIFRVAVCLLLFTCHSFQFVYRFPLRSDFINRHAFDDTCQCYSQFRRRFSVAGIHLLMESKKERQGNNNLGSPFSNRPAFFSIRPFVNW